jgi:tRNA (uracil-5-)-methyltransferase
MMKVEERLAGPLALSNAASFHTLHIIKRVFMRTLIQSRFLTRYANVLIATPQRFCPMARTKRRWGHGQGQHLHAQQERAQSSTARNMDQDPSDAEVQVSRVKRVKKSAKEAKKDGNEAVILADIERLLAAQPIRNEDDLVYAPPERLSEVKVKISEISSGGDGLGLASTLDHVYVVPFSIPGDVILAKIIRCHEEEKYSLTDFVKVLEPSAQRDDSRIKCKYFAKCSGCSFQMMAYEDQLAHKKTIIERAYKKFSTLPPELIPVIGDTIGSPLEYGYRTKLTPHFDGPPGPRRNKSFFKEVPPIGFMIKGTRNTMDIEECPIGTEVLNLGMRLERQKIKDEISSYKRGATILLRESTNEVIETDPTRTDSPPGREIGATGPDAHTKGANGFAASDKPTTDISNGTITYTYSDKAITKQCVTDQNAKSVEYIDDFVFENTAGAFFQNNNSILPRFTGYIRDHVLPPPSSKPIKFLIDAYCGSGLFTITLSSMFTASTGIDIAPTSITAARKNAKANNIPSASFIAADAANLFAEVDYPPDETVVIIDPPRKGCDEPFLRQLLKFAPRRIVYVSCNVHTQARDVSVLVEGVGGAKYDLESLRGFDFFPQTSHVEGVAVLNLVEESYHTGDRIGHPGENNPEALDVPSANGTA